MGQDRRRRPVARVLSRMVAMAALLLMLLPAAPASANHGTCWMRVYKPWAVHNSNGNTTHARGAAESGCASGTIAYMEVTLQRWRGWYWQEVASKFVQLGSNGQSGFRTATYYCDGDGTYTYRTMGELQVKHPGQGNSTPDWYHFTQLSPENRFTC